MKHKAILIGRFQIPAMNESCRKLIEAIRKQHSELVLVLAEPKISASRENPLPVQSRIAMIKEAFPDIAIHTLKDHPLDDEWSKSLDKLIDEISGNGQVMIYSTRERFINYYSGKHPTSAIPDEKSEDVKVEEESGSISFRRGMVHAASKRYASVFPTVDVVVFRKGRSEMLLGKKDIDGKWRLIGGFADPSDDGFAAAAKRELNEECGDIQTTELAYENSFSINDWRYRFEQDKIITTLFSTDYVAGTPQAQDDVADLEWFSLEAVAEMVKKGETAREHEQMFRFLLKKYGQEP